MARLFPGASDNDGRGVLVNTRFPLIVLTFLAGNNCAARDRSATETPSQSAAKSRSQSDSLSSVRTEADADARYYSGMYGGTRISIRLSNAERGSVLLDMVDLCLMGYEDSSA